ncbi:hypothetical protein [Kribbella pratensis]|uniref:Uncharacterized protein n=1 Tax=Kribbella pratensis TaxID=2512112 RepID=A0A4R8CHU6_9ACTN|nr:hypothetical protein [Kribbella pratensis]TDW75714.1 hypothetical protein EV653_0849 [Kribbella pratensis]
MAWLTPSVWLCSLRLPDLRLRGRQLLRSGMARPALPSWWRTNRWLLRIWLARRTLARRTLAWLWLGGMGRTSVRRTRST